MEEHTPVTLLLQRMASGDRAAEEELFPLIYRELRRVARSSMGRERADHTLQPTALVHEVYIRLAAAGGDWKNRAHFFGVAAGMMRRVLIDHARKRGSVKRGSAALKIEWDDGLIGECLDLDQFLDVDKAIRRLAKVDERMARVVELRCFGGLTEEEIGLVIDLSPRTVKRDWRVAKEWLKAELSRKPRASTGKQGS